MMWNTDKHKPQGKHRTCTCMAKDNYSTKRTYYYESTRELCNGQINKASIGSYAEAIIQLLLGSAIPSTYQFTALLCKSKRPVRL